MRGYPTIKYFNAETGPKGTDYSGGRRRVALHLCSSCVCPAGVVVALLLPARGELEGHVEGVVWLGYGVARLARALEDWRARWEGIGGGRHHTIALRVHDSHLRPTPWLSLTLALTPAASSPFSFDDLKKFVSESLEIKCLKDDTSGCSEKEVCERMVHPNMPPPFPSQCVHLFQFVFVGARRTYDPRVLLAGDVLSSPVLIPRPICTCVTHTYIEWGHTYTYHPPTPHL